MVLELCEFPNRVLFLMNVSEDIYECIFLLILMSILE